MACLKYQTKKIWRTLTLTLMCISETKTTYNTITEFNHKSTNDLKFCCIFQG